MIIVSSFMLKFIALFTMLIDHIGVLFFPSDLIWRYIGRISFPIFTFQIGNGFNHTKSTEKYIVRMLIFAIISQIPYSLFHNLINNKFSLNIGFTLTLGLLLLYSYKHISNIFLKIISIIFILIISYFTPIDYGIYGVILIFLMYICNTNKLLLPISLGISTIIYCNYHNSYTQMYALLSLIFILLYNGKKGINSKWLFYIFYPLHLLLLVLLKLYIL